MSEEYSIGYEEGYQKGFNDAMDSLKPAPAVQPLKVKEIAEFVGTHDYGPEQLKWFRLGEAAHGIKE